MSGNDQDDRLVCPVCQARFRSQRRCSRCGADLSPLMVLAAKAFFLRQAGRTALLQGCYDSAQKCARESQSLRATAAGHRLSLFASCLVRLSQDLPLPVKETENPLAAVHHVKGETTKNFPISEGPQEKQQSAAGIRWRQKIRRLFDYARKGVGRFLGK